MEKREKDETIKEEKKSKVQSAKKEKKRDHTTTNTPSLQGQRVGSASEVNRSKRARGEQKKRQRKRERREKKKGWSSGRLCGDTKRA